MVFTLGPCFAALKVFLSFSGFTVMFVGAAVVFKTGS